MQIKNSTGKLVYSTPDIARLFQKYYSTLYSVRPAGEQVKEFERRGKIQIYLKEGRLLKLVEEKLLALERPITQEEIFTALKDTTMGKSPGLGGFPASYYAKRKDQLAPK